jgi:pimeloyl-ACP methyl ester carboxylesterase
MMSTRSPNSQHAINARLLNAQLSILNSLLDPLSSVTVPLLNGLARYKLLRDGATRQDVRLNGMTINYYRQAPQAAGRGAGEPGNRGVAAPPLPILLIHGIADGALTWVLVLGSLARDYEVYAIDLPGYGLSGAPAGRGFARLDEMRDVLASFVRVVIGRPALIVGNSMGGWLAVKLAWAAPELARGIILMNAGGAPLDGRASWEQFADMIGVRDLKTSRQIFRQMFGAIPAPLLYLGQRGLQELFQRQVVSEFVASMVATSSEEELLRPDELRRLPVPAALIWGLSDTFLPRGSLEFFRENLPGAPMLLLGRCGHLPQRERPRSVAGFIRQYATQFEGVRIENRESRTTP